MTYQEIATMIAGIGLPYAYYQFGETGQEPPFICFYYENDNDTKADNSNYQKIERLVIELYTPEKSFTLESAVESALRDKGLSWSRNEENIDSEKMIQNVYETDVIIVDDESE